MEEVLKEAGVGLDAQGLEPLKEDLRSSCPEEITVFRAFADTVAEDVPHPASARRGRVLPQGSPSQTKRKS